MIYYQLKLFMRPSVWLTLIVTCLLPLFVPFKDLNTVEMIFQSERYMILLGMILLADIMTAEGFYKINDIIHQTRWRHNKTLIIRILLSLITLLFCFVGLLIYAYLNHSEINMNMLLNVLITSVYLGIIGHVIAALTNLSLGYMMIFFYYVLDLMTKGKIFGALTLFGCHINGLSSKLPHLIVTVILITFSYIIHDRRPSSGLLSHLKSNRQ